MPMEKALYPADWATIAEAAKKAADYRCQRCKKRAGDWTFNRFGQRARVQIGVAHLDHDPHNPQARLAVLCRSCHCAYDASHEQRARKSANMARTRGQLDLFARIEAS